MKLLTLLLPIMQVAACTAFSQDLLKDPEGKPSPFNVEAFLGAVEGKAESAAVRIAVDVTSKLNVESFHPVGEMMWKIAPDIKILTGGEDSYNGFNAKLTATGALISDDVMEGRPAGLLVAHMFPISAGAESDADFQTINGILEIGYVPWLNSSVMTSQWGKGGWLVVPGAFLQTGFKFTSDEIDPKNPVTPDNDESQEESDDFLARAKLAIKAKSPVYPLFTVGETSLNTQLLITAEGWYDMSNSEVYHRLVGTLRLILDEKKSFDLNYEAGSGAPNFNEGDQFSAGLTIAF